VKTLGSSNSYDRSQSQFRSDRLNGLPGGGPNPLLPPGPLARPILGAGSFLSDTASLAAEVDRVVALAAEELGAEIGEAVRDICRDGRGALRLVARGARPSLTPPSRNTAWLCWRTALLGGSPSDQQHPLCRAC
jgi:hypothetical protein